MLRRIPQECARVAGQDGNALFGRLVIANLERLRGDVAVISGQVNNDRLSRFLPIEAAVLRNLEDARLKCQVADREFYTPDLLLALIEIPGGRVARCFELVQKGLGEDIRRRLRHYADSLRADAAGPYRVFDWTERPDVQRAQLLAWQAGASALSDLDLLLGVLDSSSKTRGELEVEFGPVVPRLRQAAAQMRKVDIRPATPGRILGGDGR